MLLANHEENKWQGQIIKRGQFVTGLDSLRDSTGISIQSLRTCINRLKSTGEILNESTNKYRLITIVKYEEYQKDDRISTSKLSYNQQTTNKQLTANKNDNKDKKNTGEITNKIMYNYEQIDNEGNPLKRVASRIDKKTNEVLISVGLMWRDMASDKLSIPKKDVIMLNLYYPIRKAYDREKWSREDFRALFTYFFNDEKIKYEDKLSFDLCLSQKYIAKYKLNQKKRSANQTNVSISSEIKL